MQQGKRWLPAVITPIVVAAFIGTSTLIANAVPVLPHRTPTQVLALALNSHAQPGFDGYLTQVSNLGLPQLDTIAGTQKTQEKSGSATSATSTLLGVLGFLAENQRLHVSVSSHGTRVQRYTSTGEQDIVLAPGSLWQWDNDTQTVTHTLLPALTVDQANRLAAAITLATPEKPIFTPDDVAKSIIEVLPPHTRIGLGSNRIVAGQGTYTLTLHPMDHGTTVDHLELNVAAHTGHILRLTIYAKGTDGPAYQFGYDKLTYRPQTADTYAFKPPAGSKVTTRDYRAPALKKLLQRQLATTKATGLTAAGALTGVAVGVTENTGKTTDSYGVSGQGWASRFIIKNNSDTQSMVNGLRPLTTPASDGSQILHTTLINLLITKMGEIRFGAVTVEALKRGKPDQLP